MIYFIVCFYLASRNIKSILTWRNERVEKQESSRSRQTRDKHYIFVELKREKAFPLGGKNYKQKKLNWEEGGGAADG